ncbi:MAG TPA: Hsp20/alpha crystallin family protein [Bacteroidales bacterium]|nr:Hsp20/alpha crystallin family protein [Bacteroidales bacterium]HPT02047.1 Hsp20/alpha crystallin family protein [Bacteroidales bacterium]
MLPVIRRKSIFPSIVDEFFGKDLVPGWFDSDTGITEPSVNIVEGKTDFRIEVAAPGLEKDDFRITLQNNVLTISSEKETSKEEKDEKFMRREFSYAQFRRSFSLPDTADSANISANHKNGVLYIAIPKKDEAKEKPAREISVS